MSIVICIGDSNTYGYDPRSFLGGRYARPWPDILSDNTGHKVVNLGENGREIPHSGYQISALDIQISENYENGATAIIMLGTNDILCEYRDHEKTVEKRMADYVKHLLGRFEGIRIIVICPPAITDLGSDLYNVSQNMRDIYRNIAAQNNVEFFDSNEWNIPIGYDRVHFTEEGHKKFAERICQMID